MSVTADSYGPPRIISSPTPPASDDDENEPTPLRKDNGTAPPTADSPISLSNGVFSHSSNSNSNSNNHHGKPSKGNSDIDPDSILNQLSRKLTHVRIDGSAPIHPLDIPDNVDLNEIQNLVRICIYIYFWYFFTIRFNAHHASFVLFFVTLLNLFFWKIIFISFLIEVMILSLL